MVNKQDLKTVVDDFPERVETPDLSFEKIKQMKDADLSDVIGYVLKKIADLEDDINSIKAKLGL